MTRALLSGIDLPRAVDARGLIIASLDTFLTYAKHAERPGLFADG
jgi:hypothetical protein